jgi:hypothetical protein
MTGVRSSPCEACPYRRDVAPGIWAPKEYAKLLDYDKPTGSQPTAGFACHATPDHYCHGWAVVHTSRGHEFDLLALRLHGYPPIPPARVDLFGSGAEAAEHGLRPPEPRTLTVAGRLVRKHSRLRVKR